MLSSLFEIIVIANSDCSSYCGAIIAAVATDG